MSGPDHRTASKLALEVGLLVRYAKGGEVIYTNPKDPTDRVRTRAPARGSKGDANRKLLKLIERVREGR